MAMEKKFSAGKIVAAVVVLLVLAIGLGLSLMGAHTLDERERLKNAPTVRAEITRIREVDDDEGGTDYRIYVTYTYLGVEYKDVYWCEKGRRPDLGATTMLQIDPDNPRKLRPDGTTGAALSATGVVLLVGTVAVAGILLSSRNAQESRIRNQQECYAGGLVTEEAVRREIIRSSGDAMESLRPYVTAGSLALVAIGCIWRVARGTATGLLVLSIAALGCWAALIVRRLWNGRGLKNLTLTEDVFAGITEEENDDTTTTWYWYEHLGKTRQGANCMVQADPVSRMEWPEGTPVIIACTGGTIRRVFHGRVYRLK